MAVVPPPSDLNCAAALVIEFRNVGKIYKSLLGNSVKAVEEFSLEVVEGEILGIAGPNGAGKTTIIAMMLGYLRPTKGTVEINGLPARTYIERNGIGYLSELIASEVLYSKRKYWEYEREWRIIRPLVESSGRVGEC